MRGLIVLLLVGCVPHIAEDPSVVVAERILAVRATPAEVAPGGVVTLAVLDADASGVIAGPMLDWAACVARLPLSEPGPFARACVSGDASALDMPQTGASATFTLTGDACRLFGPDPPPATAGQSSGRPVDADSTGGYTLPIRVALADGTVAFAPVRLHCGVSGATQSQAAELTRRYHPNTHPALGELTAIHADGSFEPITDGVPLHVGVGEALSMHAAWADCADEMPCDGAERYARFDRDASMIVSARESIRISWAGTIGHWDAPRTGRASDDPSVTTDGTWHAPDEAAIGTLFVVLRDDREGVSWTTINVIVE